jgi:hypothetical protein
MISCSRLLAAVAAAILTIPVAMAQQVPSTVGTPACTLQATVNCPTNLGAGASGTCTATMLNVGNGTCSGEIFTGFLAPDLTAGQATFTGFTNSLGLAGSCFDNSEFPTIEPFAFCEGTATLGSNQSFTMSVNVAPGAGAPANLSIAAFTEFIDPNDSSVTALGFGFSNVATPTCTPIAQVPPATQSGLSYDVSWSQTSNPATTYEIDESTAPDFSANLNVQTVGGLSRTYTHSISSATTFYYRVRATSCGGGPGPFSPAVSIVVQPLPPSSTKAADTVVPIGSTTPVVVATIFIPGTGSGKAALDSGFTAVVDQPFLTVMPASGTIPPNGTTVTVTANPTNLPVGANTGTVKITNTTTNGTQNVPVSVSVVTPVANQPKTTPPPNALIIPVVTHVNGATAPFQSDVRLTNAGPASVDYRVTFTPTRTNGAVSSKVTDITVVSQQTVALNDVAKDFFGFGATGNVNDVGFGSLDIRPLNSGALTNYASSRTYATRPDGGTLGQFVPAIPFSSFATRAASVSLPGMGSGAPGDVPVLSMQQVSVSSKFRTNLGLVEGSGAAASGKIKVYDDSGTLINSTDYSLQPFEHQQFSLADRLPAMATLNDGRVEVTVESAAGAVQAYASVLDNITTDPLAVSPVQVAKVHATRYVLPGVAELISGTNFHSDIRIYNGGSAPAVVRMTYFPLSNIQGMLTGDPVQSDPITIGAGQVKAIDNVLPTQFHLTTGGGSLVATTDIPSSLVLTERTYSNAPGGGTFGQFIPGVTPDQGIALGDRPLQILQLEQSAAFRTNVGIVELTGNPVTVRLTLSVPSTKVSPFRDVPLPANGFIQIGGLINGLLNTTADTFNARIAVQVISGSGRVTAYGSVIDNTTSDPTYVPAQ